MLKGHIHGPKISGFWGILTPKIYGNTVHTTNRHILARNDAFLAVFGPDQMCCVAA